MDPVIDKLVGQLRDPEVESRRKALEDLSKLDDKLHIIPAIHWTMLNDVDDGIRRYAREIYTKIGETEKRLSQDAVEKAAQVSRSKTEDTRVHIKPTLGWPNPYGNWSIHLCLVAIGLILAAFLVESGFGSEGTPRFVLIMRYIGTGIALVGIILGIVGLVRAGERKISTPIWGIVLNGVILLVRIREIIGLLRA